MEVDCQFPLALMYADKNFINNLLRYICKNIYPSGMRMSQCNFRKTIALEYTIQIVGCILIRGKVSVSIQEVPHCLFYNRKFTIASCFVYTIVSNLYIIVA